MGLIRGGDIGRLRCSWRADIVGAVGGGDGNLFAVGLCGDEGKGKMTFAICFAAAKRLAVRRGDRDGATRFGGAADTGAILTNYHVFWHFRRGTVRRDNRRGGAFVFATSVAVAISAWPLVCAVFSGTIIVRCR